jgi:hypothetical protein
VFTVEHVFCLELFTIEFDGHDVTHVSLHRTLEGAEAAAGVLMRREAPDAPWPWLPWLPENLDPDRYGPDPRERAWKLTRSGVTRLVEIYKREVSE